MPSGAEATLVKRWHWEGYSDPCQNTSLFTISPTVWLDPVFHQREAPEQKELFYSGSLKVKTADHVPPTLTQSISHEALRGSRTQRASLGKVLLLLWTPTYYLIYKDSTYSIFCFKCFAYPQSYAIPTYPFKFSCMSALPPNFDLHAELSTSL